MALSCKNQDSPTENPHPFPHPLFLPVPDPHLGFLGKESPPGEKMGGCRARQQKPDILHLAWKQLQDSAAGSALSWREDAQGLLSRCRGMVQFFVPASPPSPAAQVPVGKICPTSLLVQVLPVLDLFSEREQLVSQSFQRATCRSPASKAHLPGITRMSRQR